MQKILIKIYKLKSIKIMKTTYKIILVILFLFMYVLSIFGLCVLFNADLLKMCIVGYAHTFAFIYITMEKIILTKS